MPIGGVDGYEIAASARVQLAAIGTVLQTQTKVDDTRLRRKQTGQIDALLTLLAQEQQKLGPRVLLEHLPG